MNEQLRAALQAMVDNFKPFRSKPMGAPNSDARIEQELQIAAYDYAVSVLLAISSATCPSPKGEL